MQKYSDIRQRIQTGDIVLFSGKGGISTGIKWALGSKWSHVGMALRVPEWDFVLVWESTTLSDLVDLDTGEARKGVQLVPLSDRVNRYEGKMHIRYLVDVERTDEMMTSLSQLRREVKGREYQKDEVELIKAAYDGPFGENTEDLRSLFCSELVAEAYQRMGLLSEEPPSNEYTPKEFSGECPLNLLMGSLSDPVEILKG